MLHVEISLLLSAQFRSGSYTHPAEMSQRDLLLCRVVRAVSVSALYCTVRYSTVLQDSTESVLEEGSTGNTSILNNWVYL